MFIKGLHAIFFVHKATTKSKISMKDWKISNSSLCYFTFALVVLLSCGDAPQDDAGGLTSSLSCLTCLPLSPLNLFPSICHAFPKYFMIILVHDCGLRQWGSGFHTLRKNVLLSLSSNRPFSHLAVCGSLFNYIFLASGQAYIPFSGDQAAILCGSGLT